MHNMSSNGPDNGVSPPLFDWVEYSVFSVMLVLSLLIGVYFGWFRKQDTVAEYMLGGKSMSVFPVTMSLVFSHVSGMTLLGIPAEIYLYGTQYISIVVCNVLFVFIVNYLYLPVFFELQLNSLFEYLELRFNKATRTLASLIFAISLIVYIPIVIYIPALAFNQVSGTSVHLTTPVVSLICIFYTSFGGLKAVVWTDVLQSIFTLGSSVFIIVVGFMKIGSISEVFRINDEGGRLELFNMAISPFERNTFWTVAVGSIFFWGGGVAVHPGAVQRFIAVPSLREAKMVMIWSSLLIFIIKVLVVLMGLLMYASYHDCDPLATKMVTKSGQLLPLYVMNIAQGYSGLTGLFISGVLSAALSAMSANLNTVAGTIYEDFVQHLLGAKKQTETQQNLVVKFIVLVLGLVCIALVVVVERLGTLFQMSMSMDGLSQGALFGIFSLGLFCPIANAKGVTWGAASSMLVMAVIVFGSQYYTSVGQLRFPGKVTSIDGCPGNLTRSLGFNATALLGTYTGVGSPVEADAVPLVFQLSYMYYAMLGTLLVFLVGLPVSYLTDAPESRCRDPRLFSPPVRKYLPQKQSHYQPASAKGDYTLVKTSADHPEAKVETENELNV